jgi:hypothetical protein
MDNDGRTDRKSSIDSSRLFAFCFEGGDAPRVEDMLSADPSLEGRADVLGGVPVCDEPFLCEKIAKKDMVAQLALKRAARKECVSRGFCNYTILPSRTTLGPFLFPDWKSFQS